MLTPAHAEGRRDLEADGPRRPKPVAEVGAHVADEPVDRLDAGDRAGEERVTVCPSSNATLNHGRHHETTVPNAKVAPAAWTRRDLPSQRRQAGPEETRCRTAAPPAPGALRGRRGRGGSPAGAGIPLGPPPPPPPPPPPRAAGHRDRAAVCAEGPPPPRGAVAGAGEVQPPAAASPAARGGVAGGASP